MNENNENMSPEGTGIPGSEPTPAPVVEPAPAAEAAPAAAPAPVSASAVNPFTAQAQAAAPQVAAPVQPEPQPAAAAPVQPYAVYEPVPQQPYQQAYQHAYSAYDQAYGASGAGQPPVPPTPPAPVYGYEPAGSAESGQKRRWPWFLLGLAVGLIIGMGGCASCVGMMAATSYMDDDAIASNSYGGSRDYGYGYGYDYGYGQRDNGQDDSSSVPQMPAVPDSESTAGTYTADEIAKTLFPDGVPTDAPAEGAVCKAGVYEVGASGQIPAGLYFMQGSENAESNFYVFEAADGNAGRYKVEDSVVYFGNYFAQLDEGDLVVFKPGGDETMYPAPSESINPTAPYNDGCYRVGIDIPAGSYTITAYEPSAAVTNRECAAYVMKDLDFDDDSIVDTAYVIPGGKQVITVTDGQYLELFAATATPVAQG